MKRERWQQIQSLFYTAADLPEDRRRDYLRDACDGDAALQQQVEDLIASESEAAGFLDGALRESAAEMMGVLPGERLGPYRITGELGHGGMGDVYLAERDDEQFQMRVAIKLIRTDAAPRRLLARFRAERQILARLEHPNIARLLDGGTTGDAPFLVMEYVAGEPIDRYCRLHDLSIRERLRLFRAVCEAVAYAHRNLVIHRDIKPSNILVTPEGVPKLLDFGIAKLMKADQEADGLTRPLERMMTPAYASPEVVRGEHVTTATDVYSLGALLYELLAGRPPIQLRSSQAVEVERVICREEPPKPSTLDRRLRGDLENIILMAMHKEAARRYASAEQLIADLDRYLTGYPVAARSDRLYRWAKFARRNRATLAAGILAAAGMAGWLVSLRAEQARTRQGFAQVRELAESLMFETDDALRPVAGTTLAREAIVKRGLRYLDGLARGTRADRKLQEELADGYERVADIQFSSGLNLGQPAGALESCQKALAIRQSLAARSPGDVLAMRKLAVDHLRISSIRLNMNDPAGCEQSFRTASRILDELNLRAPRDAAVRLDLARLYQNEAGRQYGAANYAAARALAEKARELCRMVLAGDASSRAARQQLADSDMTLLQDMSGMWYTIAPEDRQAALEVLREAEKMVTGLAAESPADSSTRIPLMLVNMRACALQNLLEPPEQIASCRKATLYADELAAADAANVSARMGAINAHHNLAGRIQTTDPEGSLAELRRAAEMADQLFAEKPDVTSIRVMVTIEHQQLGDFLRRRGQSPAALLHLRRAIQIREPLLLDPTDTRPRMMQAIAYSLIGEIEKGQNNCRDALVAYQASVKLYTPMHDQHKLDPHGESDLATTQRRIAECSGNGESETIGRARHGSWLEGRRRQRSL